MGEIVVKRWYHDDCTISRVHCGDFQCFALELADRDNQPSISCIPEGSYEYFKRLSKKNGPVLQLKNVPDRSYIQFHSGNYTSQILGCVLPGDSIKWLNRDRIPDVSNSRNTLIKLMNAAGDSGVVRFEK